jgi:hypothetical protein
MNTELAEWVVVVGYVCLLPLEGFLAGYAWTLRAHADALYGKLLLRVPRPVAKAWDRVDLLFWLLVALGGTRCVYLLAAYRPVPVLEFLVALVVTLSLIPAAALSGSQAQSYLEFRERGIVRHGVFDPWDNIQEWHWAGPHFTLQVKTKNAIRNNRMRPADKAAVEMVLEEHLRRSSEAST